MLYEVITHKLLEHPNVDFHCMDLMEAVVDERSQTTSIDQKAKAQYQKRIKELQLDIEDAEAFNQIEKIEALREEYDSIVITSYSIHYTKLYES